MPAMPMADPRRGVAQDILIAYPAACAELIPVKVCLCSRRKALLCQSEAYYPIRPDVIASRHAQGNLTHTPETVRCPA